MTTKVPTPVFGGFIGYKDEQTGPSVRERMEAILASHKEVVETASALMRFIDGPQISPKVRENGREIRENALRRALAAWKEE